MSTKTLKRAIDKILTKDAEFKVGQKVRYRDKPMPAIFVKYLSDTEAVVRYHYQDYQVDVSVLQPW